MATMRHRMLVQTAAASLLAALVAGQSPAASAAEGPPDGSTPEQQAAIAADPAFRAQPLVIDLRGKPRHAESLFDGRDLSAWDSWLGYPDPAKTYTGPKEAPIGLNHDDSGVFRVVSEDGRPAIFVSGKVWGGLITKRVYANYHLRLQFKWGARTWTPMPRNNGVLYHSHGRYGAFFGTWMSAVEFELVPHSIGMLLCVGDSQGKGSFADVDWKVTAKVPVGHDPAIVYPSRRYMLDGRVVPVAFPGFNVDAAVDAEKPVGEWNTLDLYVYGDQSVHVVNGVPVMVAHDLSTTEAGRRVALTSGKIQLQSEGAETYFRDITIEPIDRLPVVRAGGSQ